MKERGEESQRESERERRARGRVKERGEESQRESERERRGEPEGE